MALPAAICRAGSCPCADPRGSVKGARRAGGRTRSRNSLAAKSSRAARTLASGPAESGSPNTRCGDVHRRSPQHPAGVATIACKSARIASNAPSPSRSRSRSSVARVGPLRPQLEEHRPLEHKSVATIGHREPIEKALEAVAREQNLIVVACLPGQVQQARGMRVWYRPSVFISKACGLGARVLRQPSCCQPVTSAGIRTIFVSSARMSASISSRR